MTSIRHYDGSVLTQSVKYMQKYSGTEYELKVSRCKKDDAGTYFVIAENSFGKREEEASLKVERKLFTIVKNSSCSLINLALSSTCYLVELLYRKTFWQ